MTALRAATRHATRTRVAAIAAVLILGAMLSLANRLAEALPRDVRISPRGFDFAGGDTHRESLGHERSHLHVTQQPGVLGGEPFDDAFRAALGEGAGNAWARFVDALLVGDSVGEGEHAERAA